MAPYLCIEKKISLEDNLQIPVISLLEYQILKLICDFKKYANYYSDDWGEQYVGKSQSVISLFCTESLEIRVLENLPEDYAPAQVSISLYKNYFIYIFKHA